MIIVDLIANLGVPWPLAVPLVLAIGFILGLGHGLLITKKRMQPFVVTLCGLLIYRGVARFYTQDATAGFPFGMRFEDLEFITTGRTDLLAVVSHAAMKSMYTRSILPSSHGNLYELYAIAAAVLGGFSLRGGEGSIVGVVLGAVLLQILQNLVNLLGIPSSLNFAVSGSVILIGVLADQEVAEFRQRRELVRSRLGGQERALGNAPEVVNRRAEIGEFQ